MVKVIIHQMEICAPKGSGYGLQGLKNNLLSSMKIRFMDIESHILLGPATLLDPRFKSKPFSNKSKLDFAKEILLSEMRTSLEIESDIKKNDDDDKSNINESDKGIWTKYKQIFTTNSKKTCENSVNDELEHYLAEPVMNPENSVKEVGHYWESSQYLRLKKLVHKFLCVPPATLFSERLFSSAGNIVDTKRNRLDPERVKMLVFLNKNLNKN